MDSTDKLIEISHELQAIASAGRLYTKNKFEKERYERVLELSAELLTIGVDGIDRKQAIDLFEKNDGYQTPKTETRAVILNEKDEVLLVKDHDGKWALPGGWCEYNLTIRENTIKEAREECGLTVEPWRLVAVHFHRKRNNPDSFFSGFKYFVLCKNLGGSFEANIETTESAYFPLQGLPEDLNTHKGTPEQIALCIKAAHEEYWEPEID